MTARETALLGFFFWEPLPRGRSGAGRRGAFEVRIDARATCVTARTSGAESKKIILKKNIPNMSKLYKFR